MEFNINIVMPHITLRDGTVTFQTKTPKPVNKPRAGIFTANCVKIDSQSLLNTIAPE